MKEWDEDANIEALDDNQVAHVIGKNQQQSFSEPEQISSRIMNDRFPVYKRISSGHLRHITNYLVSVCHNCGWVGHKYVVHSRSRCSACHSSNITIVRAGVLSLLLRENPDVGLHIPQVKANRKQELKESRLRLRRGEETERHG